MAKSITAFKLRSELIVEAQKHSSAYKKAEGEVQHYEQAVKKSSKEVAKAFDGAQVGAKFGRDMGVSAIAALGQSFNVSTLGSIIGTAVAPGIGTAIGSAIGGGIDKALSTVAPMVLNTIQGGMELNKVLEETRLEFKTLVGSEQEANKYLNELLDISKDIGILPRTLIDTSERLSDLTGDLQLTRKLLKAAADQAADFGGGVVTFNKIADSLGLMAEKGELSSRELQKLYRVGINAKKILAEATGLQEKQIDSLIKQGRIRGDVAARLIAEGIDREKGGLAGLKTSQTVAGRERQAQVLLELRAAEATQKATAAYGDVLRDVNAILGSSQAKQVVAFFDKIAGGIIDFLKVGIKSGVSIGGGIAQGMLDGSSLTSMLGSFTKMKDWVGSSLSSLFESKSPSEWSAREVGEPLGEGIGLGLVRRFSGFMQGEGAESIKQTLEQLLSDPKIQALLNTIEKAEGGAVGRIVGGRDITPGRAHPNIVGMRTSKGPSTAAGSYQITGTNWRKAERALGPLDFSSKHDQALVALWLMTGRGGGADILRGGNISQMMGLAAKDWTSTPGSTIGGGGQWNRNKWLNTYQGFLGGGGGPQITAANPLPVRIATGDGKFLDNLQSFTASNLANFKRGNEVSEASEFNRLFMPAIQDGGEAIVNVTSSFQDFVTTTSDIMTDIAMVPMRTLSPVLLGELEIAKARAKNAGTSIKITKAYEEANREALIVSEGVLSRFSGMLSMVAGMVPGQQTGKKRGLFSKILGFAAPFLSFIPGVGPILSQIAGMASNAVAGNWGGVVTGLAGGITPGGVFNPTRTGGGSPPINPTPWNLIPGVPSPRALGGPGVKGRMYWTGERGPEPFLAPANGQFLSHRDAMSAMSSGDAIGGGDATGMGALIERLVAQLDRHNTQLERMEYRRPDDVVMMGANGLNRAMDRNASLAEAYGRRLNLAR